MIHDLDYLRFPRDIKKYILDGVRKMDVVIVSSNEIKNILQVEEIESPIVVRGPWDYLNYGLEKNLDTRYSRIVNYAGNVSDERAGFIKMIDDAVNLRIFGDIDEKFHVENTIDARGSVIAEQLPNFLTDGFGLAWNGIESNQPTGLFGEYMQYVWLHKFCLYLASGMPVIVWSKGPMARFVQQYKVGVTIDSIDEIDMTISEAEDDFNVYANNAKQIAKLLKTGFYTQKCTLEAMELLLNKY